MTDNVIPLDRARKARQGTDGARPESPRRRQVNEECRRLEIRWQQIQEGLNLKRSRRANPRIWRVPKDDPDCARDVVTISQNFHRIVTDICRGHGIRAADLAKRLQPGETTRIFDKLWLPPKHEGDQRRIDKLTRKLDRRLSALEALAAMTDEDETKLKVELFENTWFDRGEPLPILRDDEHQRFGRLAATVEEFAQHMGEKGQAKQYFRQLIKYRLMPDPRAGRRFLDGTVLIHDWGGGATHTLDPTLCLYLAPELCPRITIYSVYKKWEEGHAPTPDPWTGKLVPTLRWRWESPVALLADRKSLTEYYESAIREAIQASKAADGWRLMGSGGWFDRWWGDVEGWLTEPFAHRLEEGPNGAEFNLLRADLECREDVDIYLVPTSLSGDFECRIGRRRRLVASKIREIDAPDLQRVKETYDPESERTLIEDVEYERTPLFQALCGGPYQLSDGAYGVAFIKRDDDLYPAALITPEKAWNLRPDCQSVAEELCEPKGLLEWEAEKRLDLRRCSAEAFAEFLDLDMSEVTHDGAAVVLGVKDDDFSYGRNPAVAPTEFSADSAAAYLQANHLYAKPGLRWFNDLARDLKTRVAALAAYDVTNRVDLDERHAHVRAEEFKDAPSE